MNDVAFDIYNRAAKKGISVSHLCREAGVTRTWFEHFKRRVPESVEAYLKIDRILSDK